MGGLRALMMKTIRQLKSSLWNAGWWSEDVRKSEDQGELLGRYGGRTRSMMSAIVISAVLLLLFAAGSSSCDLAWSNAMGRFSFNDDQDQWKLNRERGTLRLCESGHKDGEGVQVCDD